MFSDLFLKMQKWNFWLLKRVQNKPIPPLSPLQYRCGGHLGFRDGKGSPHHFQNIAPFKFFKISFSTRVQSVTLLSQLCGLVAHSRPIINDCQTTHTSGLVLSNYREHLFSRSVFLYLLVYLSAWLFEPPVIRNVTVT